MADNVELNAGSGGASLKTDEDLGDNSHVQVVKVELGIEDEFDGYVAATNPMPGQLIEVSASGSHTAVDESTTLDVIGYGAVAFQITGTWSATVGFDATLDGTNWVDLPVSPIAAGQSVTTTTVNGIWLANIGGLQQVRLYIDSFTSGTVVVNLQASVASGGASVRINGRNVAGTDGTAGPASTLSVAGTQSDGTLQEIRVNASGQVEVTGDTAHDAADTGDPVKVGGRAHTTLPTAAANNDRVNQTMTTQGAALIAGASGTTPTNVAVSSGGNLAIVGNVAHDSPALGNPLTVGVEAQNVGATPTAVADADVTRLMATRYGQLFTLGGHMNPTRREFRSTAGETNTDILGAVAAGNRVVVLAYNVVVDNGVTVDVDCRIGFGTTTVPSEPADGAGVNGMLFAHPGIAPGSGISEGNGGAILAVGGDDEELRMTCDAPTGGEIKVNITYFVFAA